MSKGGAPNEQDKKIQEMLSKARIVQQQAPVTQRMHQVIFMGVSFGFLVRVDEEKKCVGYQIQIDDPSDSTSYIFPFDHTILQHISEKAMSFPNIGEVFEEPSA